MPKFIVTFVCLAFVVAACAGGKGSRAAVDTITTPTSSVAIPRFSGDISVSWCAYAHQVQATTQLNGTVRQDPKAWVAQVTALLAQAETAAPAAITADVAIMAVGVRGLAQALTANQDDFSKLNPEQLAAIQAPAFVAAGQRVRAYDQQVCHTPN